MSKKNQFGFVRYYKNAEIRDKGIKYFLKFLKTNIKELSRETQTKVYSLAEGYKLEGKLTGKQYNLLEGIYERYMKNKGLGGADTHHDLKKGLRY